MLLRIRQLISWIRTFRITETTELYPEVIKAGGFGKALNLAFEEINSPLRVTSDNGSFVLPFSYARVENENRFSQIYMASQTKLYLSDYWRDGVCLANGSVEDIKLLALSLQTWLDSDISTSQLAQEFNFIRRNDKAQAFDEGREVEYTWNEYLNDQTIGDLKDVIVIAMQDEILGKLFPFTSLSRLCFSRCTGYPYSGDIPNITPMGNDKYEVMSIANQSLGIGNAEEALKIVKDYLPPGIKPAIRGTVEDLETSAA